MRQRIHRQPKPNRRISRNQVTTLGAKKPGTTGPCWLAGSILRLERQDVADYLLKPLLENLGQPHAVLLVSKIRFERIDVRRQAPFPPEIVPGILEGGNDPLSATTQPGCQSIAELLRSLCVKPVILRLVGKQFFVHP